MEWQRKDLVTVAKDMGIYGASAESVINIKMGTDTMKARLVNWFEMNRPKKFHSTFAESFYKQEVPPPGAGAGPVEEPAPQLEEVPPAPELPAQADPPAPLPVQAYAPEPPVMNATSPAPIIAGMR